LKESWILRAYLWLEKSYNRRGQQRHKRLEMQGRIVRSVKSKWPFILGLLSVLALVSLLASGGAWAWFKYFDNRYSSLQIQGLHFLDRSDILQKFPFIRGELLINIDSSIIQNQILSIPEIEKVNLKIHLGGQIDLSIQEASALAKTQIENQWWILLSNGSWTHRNEFEINALPIIENEMTFVQNSVNTPEKSLILSQYLLNMKDKNPFLYKSLSQMRVQGLDLYCVWNHFEFVTIMRTETSFEDIENQLKIIKQNKAEISRDSTLKQGEFDLRFSGMAFLRPLPTIN
jgi:hypothetical protein